MSVTNTTPDSKKTENSYKLNCCDGFDCSDHVNKKVNVSAGKFGNISLNLCLKCARLFEN